MKILGIAPIPTEELFKLRSECEALYNHIDNLLHLSDVETPSDETPKKEASSDPNAEASAEPQKETSSDPNAEASAEPKQEASADDEINGLVVHNYAQKKPFEMVIE